MAWWQIGKKDADLERELRSDLELEEEEQQENGLSREEARYAAKRAFGNPSLIREQTRAVWSWNWVESLVNDLRYGLRTLSRAPGFTFIAVVVIALGIGANVALFTVVRNVLLKPLPFHDPDRLVFMYEAEKDRPHHTPWLPVDAGSFWEWQSAAHSVAEMALISPFQSYNVSAQGGKLPELVDASWCSSNFFSLLGVHPVLGRDFTANDDRARAEATVILSDSFWKRRYGADPAIVGKTIWLDAKAYTILGVLPYDFVYSGSLGGNTVQVWTPVGHEAPPSLLRDYGGHEFQVVARLASGVSMKALLARLDALQKQIKIGHPSPSVHNGVIGRTMLDDAVDDYKTPLYALLAATGCVLLIAYMNVGGLLVARAATRNREFAIRTALGGGRLRLIRVRLMESAILSAVGGLIGMLLAQGVLTWLIHSRTDMNRVQDIRIDGSVALFTLLLIAFCAISSGLISTLTAADKNVLAGLQEGSRAQSSGRPRASLRRLLLSSEVGLTIVLLVGAGLLLKSFQRLRSAYLGVPIDNVLTLKVNLPSGRYRDPARQVEFFERLIASVRSLPGISGAGLVSSAPGEGYGGDTEMRIVEHPRLPPGQGMDFMLRGADGGYFEAIGLPVLKGRTFGADERMERANVVLISRGAAEQYFPGEDPVGKHIQTLSGDGTWEVIGIVGDVRWKISQPPRPTLYWPIYGNGYSGATIVVRALQDANSLALPVQRIVGQLDPDLPVAGVMTLREAIGKSTINSQFDSVLVLAFASIALVLAAAGLYGVLAYLVAQRTAEFGIRIALGARREHILSKVLVDGMRPAFTGLILGLLTSAVSARLIRSMLYETQPLDLAVFTSVSGILLLVAIAACIVPAWRAAHLDPVQALRNE
jgi:predicted permease